jgi:hypothetical protein
VPTPLFLLMAIDAVFPAASELVTLYAGALAGGAIPHAHASFFGSRLADGVDAYLVLSAAGALGYLAGAWVGWGIGRFGAGRCSSAADAGSISTRSGSGAPKRGSSVSAGWLSSSDA